MKIFTPRIPLKDKMFFVEHLAVMLKASIPIDQALRSLNDQTQKRGFRSILQNMVEMVQKGEPLSSALKLHEAVFGSFFINIVQAGEYSGKLEGALRHLHRQMKKDYELRSKVRSALAYPAFVVVAMLGIGTAIMLFVVPKLITLFEGFNAELPIATRILIAVSKFLSEYTLITALSMIVLIVVFVKLIRGPLKLLWHTLLLRIPLIGGILQKISLARFARTFSTLLATDILVVESLKITAKVIGSVPYEKALLLASEQIQQGVAISDTLKPFQRLFPSTVHTMIRVGEESGTLTDLLSDVANFYEESVDETTKSLSSIIEPLLIVLLGGAVGGMALAILMPMYTLMQAV